MSDSKHTPSPWNFQKLDKDSDFDGAFLVQSSIDLDPMEIVVFNNGREYTKERHEADARLVACAPEMLAALELILEDNRLMNAMSSEQARAVMYSVGKAKGPQNE